MPTGVQQHELKTMGLGIGIKLRSPVKINGARGVKHLSLDLIDLIKWGLTVGTPVTGELNQAESKPEGMS